MLRPKVRSRAALTGAAVALALGGCGAAAPAEVAAPAPRTCAATVDAVLRHVALRTYRQAAAGRNVASSVRRLARSPALAVAVARDDPAATRAALRPLLRNQIKRIVVTRGAHVLAHQGTQPALAPVPGVIRDAAGAPVGRYTLSVAGDAGLAGFLHAITGARVVVHAGRHRVAYPASPTRSEAPIGSLRGTAFPAGALRVSLLAPRAPQGLCTVAGVDGTIGVRLFRAERDSAATARVLRIVAHDRRFVTAVEHDDAATVRARTISFFRNRTLHVVRVRAVTAAGRLVNDVGGPYVLAPAAHALRSHGRVVGRVTLSIQDDTGYIKLLHRVTGAAVILRTQAGAVPGSNLSGGPTTIPPRGRLTYAGRRYQAFGFTATAFPSGPLRISLLVRDG